VFKKEDKKDQEVRGSVALSSKPTSPKYFPAGLHRGIHFPEPARRRRCNPFLEKQANEENRCIIFTGLFKQPLLSKLFYHINTFKG